jgi:hypothetical protein
MVTLYAGDSNEAFTVHKEFACHYSPVLKTAFNSNFIEGQTQTYRLQETTERAVRLLVPWFYTQKLDTFVPKETKEAVSDERKAESSQDAALVELWVLAEKLLIPTLQNMVAREILECSRHAHEIQAGILHYVYEKTGRGSLLRRLIVDMCFRNLGTNIYQKYPERFPQEMLIELVTVFSMKIPVKARISIKPMKKFSRYEVADQ